MALASRASAGKEVSFGEDEILVAPARDNFEGFDVGLFSPGAAVSKIRARAYEAGCVVIDNTSQFRMDEGVPLVVPEVNREALAGFRERNIIANPNCSTIQMVMALKPLHDLALVRRGGRDLPVGLGAGARDGRAVRQTKGDLRTARPSPSISPSRSPSTSSRRSTCSSTTASRKSGRWRSRPRRSWTRRSRLRRPACASRCSSATRSRPTSSSSTRSRSRRRARRCEFEGVLLIDDPADGAYVTPAECVGEYAVFVSRLRRDPTVPHGLQLWIVADNLRKGAALNAVQIAEALVEEGYL